LSVPNTDLPVSHRSSLLIDALIPAVTALLLNSFVKAKVNRGELLAPTASRLVDSPEPLNICNSLRAVRTDCFTTGRFT